MLDALITPVIKPLLQPLIYTLDKVGATADRLTVIGFAIGLIAVPLIITEHFSAALVFIVLNRVIDGLDGELARYQKRSSSAGGYLDIALDFLFYASIPLAFGLANPALWAVPAMVLLVSFIGTGSSFLAFAIAAEKFQINRPQFENKSFYYMQGLTEGAETIAFFIAFCLWPQWFTELAYIFAGACSITIITRIAGGYKTLQRAEKMSVQEG
ncbi:CDP-alcohol phosphatidyltransferase family protein [Salinimonas sediminis]|uniref:CDP-alcohol phosphatidyltransferase family protein n=1 Tax=Salinimonas sediminis TaxID=2303538 RepID=A0A346NL55_9ALTE|nr:CDP-alcohol phosphatidyltransferase family protein [Salinimonas sediminis]AXR06262.1 CDP-alcohol phosphatidyltransferase family protein [Salinimonas sediminis]